MENVIALKNKFVIDRGNKQNNKFSAMQVAAELMQFGYLLNEAAINTLSNYTLDELTRYHSEVITYLKDMTGANRNYKPFWKGFPQQVMEKSEYELWFHQIVHYISNGKYEPSDWTRKRSTAFEHSDYTVINVCSWSDFDNIFTKLVSVNQSLTVDDLAIVKWFVSSGRKLNLPDVIPFKENLTTLASVGVPLKLKSVTDVLRVAVGMSGGDVSLPKVPAKFISLNSWSRTKSKNIYRDKFKFKNFSRKERRYIISLLENSNCDVTEAVLKLERWKRLGEKLHIGDFATQYPRSAKFFATLRNQKVQSWYGKVQNDFKYSVADGLASLSTRPGEFARKLDFLLRTYSEEKVLSQFKKIGKNISNKVLFELYTHFETRAEANQRSIMVKGSRSKKQLKPLKPFTKNLVSKVQKTIIDIFADKFKNLPNLGTCFLDENLKKLPVPTNMRSLNASLRPKIRGERVPIGNQNAKVVRAYVHWFDKYGREDIDLTATFIGDKNVKRIGWNGSHNDSIGCYSGDVRHRIGACAEYIDIDIDNALYEGYNYAILDARNYNGRSLDSLTDCVFGYMEREFPNSNEIFVPATLANSVKLESKSATTIVVAIDLNTREYIYLDVDTNGIPVASANVSQIMTALSHYISNPKFSVYDLLKLHIDNRGKIVDNAEDAENVFSLKDFSESYIKTLEFMGV